jgi:threonylcarbamoyladenosine tRNA methylthiotransferase MtaB
MMRRNYDAAFFRDLVLRICGSIPDLAVGIDVIAGFPGETEAEFHQTLAMIESLPVAYLHVFPFSGRPGTPAAKMAGQVPESEKKKRVQLLRETGMAKRRGFAESFIGKPLKVLIEGRRDKSTGLPVGFSENYIQVAVRGDNVKVNSIVSVIPEAVNEEGLFASPIAPAPLFPVPERGKEKGIFTRG